METNVNYTAVGIFVISLGVIFIVGLLWLTVGLSSKDYETYLVFMNESVSGLSPKAPVKYSGVVVGYVESVDLRRDDPQNVKIKLAIEDDTPVSVDTRAVLDTQGLTGISYIELKGGEQGSPRLTAAPGHKYPVIKTEPSLLFRLDQALNHLTVNLDEISGGLTAVLNKKNTRAFSEILRNMDKVTERLAENSTKIESLINDAQITLHNSALASQQLPQVMANISTSSETFERVMVKLDEASNEANKAFRNGNIAVETLNDQFMPEAVSAFSDVRAVLDNLRSITSQLEQNPAVLVRGRQPLPPGPGEK